ncbi:hypothetical protein SDC9_175796 [bioreactor metagenome]|uniref:Uncharacterized protein n=1 Tax=bioreactor metagenome TaxID=1076179 RepID=A0A645GNQ9_9ZZZZ
MILAHVRIGEADARAVKLLNLRLDLFRVPRLAQADAAAVDSGFTQCFAPASETADCRHVKRFMLGLHIF